MQVQSEDNDTNCTPIDTEGFRNWNVLSTSIFSVLSILGALLVILFVSLRPQNKKKSPANENDPLIPDNTSMVTIYAPSRETTTAINDTEAPNDDGRGALIPERKKCCTCRVVDKPAKPVLVSISVANILVASSHLWGAVSNFETALSEHGGDSRYSYDFAECGAQALVTVFGTIASFLWSDILMFIAVVTFRCKETTRKTLVSVPAFMVYNFVGWVLPFLVITILGGGLDAFGTNDGVKHGWCYLNTRTGNTTKDFWIHWFGYEMWADFSIVFILGSTLLVLLTFCADKFVVHETPEAHTGSVVSIIRNDKNAQQENLGYQVLTIIAAVMLVILRIWSTTINVYFFKRSLEKSLRCNAVLQVLSAIGASSQGLVNGMLFVIIPLLYKLCCYCYKKIRNK